MKAAQEIENGGTPGHFWICIVALPLPSPLDSSARIGVRGVLSIAGVSVLDVKGF